MKQLQIVICGIKGRHKCMLLQKALHGVEWHLNLGLSFVAFKPRSLFQWISCSHQMTKILEFQLQHQSFQLVFRVDFPLRFTGLTSLLSKGLSGAFFSTTVWRHWFFGILLLKGLAPTTLCGHWEDHTHDYTDLCWQRNVSAFQHTV